ncbi:EamA family transporter [Gracilimonas mengyeensis]|uniref:EamA-like transporter family protein n=1 Tax=Gracilimonas mengyeensis TaxID=1302730 RepID=A0A521ANL0_9BACT|nr:EamA family transporter [Gracilimonas mengyeensis]SMO36392.1 EamA-like transporter family protein [Gracilimonas mengyeensis]
MALIYIALSIGCSLILAQILKLAENQKLSVLHVLVSNYAAGCLISLWNAPEWGGTSFFPETANLGWGVTTTVLLLGLVFIANLLVYSKSIHRVGMGVSIAAMRMSLVFPIGVSLFVFGEQLVSIRYIGILVALASLLLMVPRIRTKSISGVSDAWLPVLIFVMTGVADTGMKVYERLFSAQISEDLFVSGIFLVSFLIGGLVLLKRGEYQITWKEAMYGVVAGLVNLYSSIFLLYALKMMPGSVVFPLVNVSLVVFGTFIGVWFWNDKPSGKQWTGLAMAVVSIFLLLG